jgi:hypothetical protein
MSHIVVERAKGCQILWIIGPTLAHMNNMMDCNPTIAVAAMAVGVQMCALASVARMHGVFLGCG